MSECQGGIYKYIVNNYIDNNGSYVEKSTMRLLKRKSCNGCEQCGWLEGSIQEYLYHVDEIFIEKPTNNALYEIIAIDQGVDYETACPDGYDLEYRLEFRLATPPKQEKDDA